MAINRKKVIQDLSKIEVWGDDQGLIPAYGVLIQQLPTNFWNLFTVKVLQSVGDNLFDDAGGLLENAAAECGYHTGWGIINSEEFKSVVMPMVEKEPEDILHGAYAVFTAWGWGNAEIVELVPGEKKVVRVYDYYEADCKEMFKPKKGIAFMLGGVARAFMDIAYGDKPYPDGFGKFKSVQTKGIELGDEYAEFIITKK